MILEGFKNAGVFGREMELIPPGQLPLSLQKSGLSRSETDRGVVQTAHHQSPLLELPVRPLLDQTSPDQDLAVKEDLLVLTHRKQRAESGMSDEDRGLHPLGAALSLDPASRRPGSLGDLQLPEDHLDVTQGKAKVQSRDQNLWHVAAANRQLLSSPALEAIHRRSGGAADPVSVRVQDNLEGRLRVVGKALPLRRDELGRVVKSFETRQQLLGRELGEEVQHAVGDSENLDVWVDLPEESP